MGTELGHRTTAGFAKNTSGWGGSPIALGAGDGFEINSESIKPAPELVPNKGVFGSPYQRPSSLGKFLISGDVNLDLYYQCFGLRFLGMCFADTVNALGGGAHRHDLIPRTDLGGFLGTLAVPGSEGVKEFGSTKVAGVKLRWDEGDQRAKLMPMLKAQDYNLNVGSPNVAFVVASVAAANGPLTILTPATTNFNPSPLTFTKVAGVTAITIAIVAEDRFGMPYLKTITTSDFVSNFWLDTVYVRRVISMTVSGLAGTGNISAGVSNGVNNATTVAAITMEAARDVQLFSQCELLINRQGDAALAAADEQFLKSFEIGLEFNLDERVTSQYGRFIDEPSIAGAGEHVKVTVAFEFSAHTDRNRTRLYDSYQGNQMKAKFSVLGPFIAASGFQHSLVGYLNGVQLVPDGPNVGNAGVEPVSFTGEAHLVAAVPSGFPGGVLYPAFLQITNGLASAFVS